MQISKLKNLIEQNQNGAGELAVVEGLHAIKHALRFNAELKIIVCKEKSEIIKLAQKLCPDIINQLEQKVEELGQDFDRLTNSKIRTGILGLFIKPEIDKKNLSEVRLAVMLDDPRDLNNIGAVVRVCAAAGINNLIITGASNAWNFRAIRAGAGLQFALNIIEIAESVVPGSFRDLPIICFDERGLELDQKLKTKIPKQAIYVFGSEREGISQNIKDFADIIVRLPMKEGVSSMNLATSVAAALYSLK